LHFKFEKSTIGEEIMDSLKVGDFIRQGRRLQYCGLTPAVLEHTKPPRGTEGNNHFSIIDNWGLAALERVIDSVCTEPSPWPWFWRVTMGACLLTLWTEIVMAFFFDFITPPPSV